MHLLPAFPEISSRYVIEGRIGGGGLGEVYRARDLRLGRYVAIKWLKPGGDEEQWRTHSALHEAKLLAAFQHPNIVTVHDLVMSPKGVLVIMEHLNGQTLENLVKDSPLTEEDFIEVSIQALEGIISAHDINMLHRDIKPANIMLVKVPGSKFYIKILDFGMAKICEQPMAQTIMHGGSSMLGSIYTMSPEQLNQDPIDMRTDLYALGCTLYYTLASRHPFDGDTIPAIMSSHLHHKVDDLREVRPDIHPMMASWVMKLINTKPDDRPKNASEALEGLIDARNAPPVVAEGEEEEKKWQKVATTVIDVSRQIYDKTVEAIKNIK